LPTMPASVRSTGQGRKKPHKAVVAIYNMCNCPGCSTDGIGGKTPPLAGMSGWLRIQACTAE
jgi:hypothetical protein